MRRDLLLLVVALAAFAGSVFAAWGTAEQRDRDLRGYANPALDAALPYYLPKLGVNVDLRQYADDRDSQFDALNAQLDMMQAASIHWVRQVVAWDEAQLSSGDFDYTKYDAILNVFRERTNVEMIAVLDGDDIPPQDAALFAMWAREFALHYGDVIDVYQVWDEPNLITSWSPEPRPEAYAALLQASYEAIHSVDADATVLAAALAPTLETGPDNISDLLYLDDLYRLGLAEFSDGIAAKPYGFSDSPTDEPDAEVMNFQRIVLLREVMLRHGDGATALWASEFGWNRLPDGWTGDESIWGEVSAEQQTAYTLEALSLAEGSYAWMGGAMLAHWQPNGDSGDARWGFALIGQNEAATPLYEALVQRQMALEAQLAAATMGLHHPTNPYTTYSGVWTLSERGADIGWVGDSQLSFTFRGDAVSLLLREGDYTAYLYITIDGAAANALPRDADGNSYLLLTSDTLEPETRLIPLARGLGDGVHTLRLAADRGWDRWAFAGFAVGGADRATPYNRQIALAGLSAGVAALAAGVFGAAVAALAAGVFGAAVARGLIDGRTRYSASLQRVLTEGGRLALGAAASVILLVSVLLTWTEATPAFFRREPIQLGLAILTAGLLYVNPALPIALLAAAVLFLLFYQRPLHGLALTLFYAPLFLFPVELFSFAFPMSELLVLITFAAWIARVVVEWAKKTQSSILSSHSFHLLDMLLLGYVALGVVSLAWTEYRGAALTELRTLFIEPCLFYVVLRFSTLRERDMLRLVDALVLSGIVVAVIGLFLFARGDAIITAEEGARRLASVYGSPNNVGLWLGRCLPFALAFVLLPLDRGRRLFGAAALVIFAPALVLTQSAGALFVGVPAALAVTLVAALGKRAWLPLGGIAAAGAVALPVLLQSARFARLLDPTEGTNFFRLRVWQSAAAMIRDFPLTGLGQDQFLRVFRGRYILPDAWQEPNLSHPHNIVLDFWLRLGMLGVVLGVALHAVLARLLLRGLALARTHGSALRAAIAVGALGCLANQVAHGLVDNSIFVNDLAYVFVLLAGLGMYLSGQNNH